MPDRRLLLFAVWAVGQGVILGSLYVATDSLLAPMLVHGMHDMIGFSLFARERRLAAGAESERAAQTESPEEASRGA